MPDNIIFLRYFRSCLIVFVPQKPQDNDTKDDSNNTNQHLHHLIETPDKKRLDQQCKDLEKLQAE